MHRNPRRDACHLSGGYLKDIPKPYIRMFPQFGPRQVRIVIMRYYGVGIHYSASIMEEDNPLWNSATTAGVNPYWEGTPSGDEVVGWQMSWDDEDGKGRCFYSQRSTSTYWVRKWIHEIIHKHFQPPENYEFVNMRGRHMWFYREGD